MTTIERDGNIVFNNSVLDPERDMWDWLLHEAKAPQTRWHFDDPELRAITETTHKKPTCYESE